MGIRQQKREKPNKFAKTGNTRTVSLPDEKKAIPGKNEKSAVRTTTASSTKFLVQDLTRTAVAFVIAFSILSAVWWVQTQ